MTSNRPYNHEINSPEDAIMLKTDEPYQMVRLVECIPKELDYFISEQCRTWQVSRKHLLTTHNSDE